MRNFTKVISISTILAASLFGNSVTATKVGSISDSAWGNAKVSEITLYPQTAMKMNDKNANVLNNDRKAIKVQVKALYTSKDVAVQVKWNDATENWQEGYSSTAYGDGFAVQVAASSQEPLPYIGMGSDGRPVAIYIRKAVKQHFEPNGNGDVYHQVNARNNNVFEADWKNFVSDSNAKALGDYQRAFVSEGVRSMTQIRDNNLNFSTTLKRDANGWTGTVVRPLSDDYATISKNAAIAVAVWDGEAMNRDGLKRLSSWISVDLGSSTLDAITNEQSKGDAANGMNEFMNNGCIGCHSNDATQNYMGPNLSNVGGYSTAAYLRESLVNPNGVIVPGYNRNAHKSYLWYNIDDSGNRVSTMPDHSWLEPKVIEDIIAYLQTLKAEVE
jgi:complex iron-sulfur molybdoenzyme family reductase subunit gamma